MYETTYRDFLWNGRMVNKDMVENYLRFLQTDQYKLFGMKANYNLSLYCKADFCSKELPIFPIMNKFKALMHGKVMENHD